MIYIFSAFSWMSIQLNENINSQAHRKIKNKKIKKFYKVFYLILIVNQYNSKISHKKPYHKILRPFRHLLEDPVVLSKLNHRIAGFSPKFQKCSKPRVLCIYKYYGSDDDPHLLTWSMPLCYNIYCECAADAASNDFVIFNITGSGEFLFISSLSPK